MDLADAAAELYGLTPSEFTAARNAHAKRARAEGQAQLAVQIGRLAKPSAAAWAVNMLARHRPAEVEKVLRLGAELREAQEDLDPARMRELGRERAGLLAVVVREGRAVAAELGVTVSDAAAEDLDQTLHAAMADPAAGEAVRGGLLVRALAASGLEPVDLAGAVAVPGARAEPARETRSRRDERGPEERRREKARALEREQAAADVAEAQRGLDEAQADLADAQGAADDADARRVGLAEELARLRDRIDALEAELAAAEREAVHAQRARRLAERLAEQERRALLRAHERLDRLDAPPPRMQS
jgi:hypothetical protein